MAKSTQLPTMVSLTEDVFRTVKPSEHEVPGEKPEFLGAFKLNSECDGERNPVNDEIILTPIPPPLTAQTVKGISVYTRARFHTGATSVNFTSNWQPPAAGPYSMMPAVPSATTVEDAFPGYFRVKTKKGASHYSQNSATFDVQRDDGSTEKFQGYICYKLPAGTRLHPPFVLVNDDCTLVHDLATPCPPHPSGICGNHLHRSICPVVGAPPGPPLLGEPKSFSGRECAVVASIVDLPWEICCMNILRAMSEPLPLRDHFDPSTWTACRIIYDYAADLDANDFDQARTLLAALQEGGYPSLAQIDDANRAALVSLASALTPSLDLVHLEHVSAIIRRYVLVLWL